MGSLGGGRHAKGTTRLATQIGVSRGLEAEAVAGPGRRIVGPVLARAAQAVHLLPDPLLVLPVGPERLHA
jgi:hypothetical protein